MATLWDENLLFQSLEYRQIFILFGISVVNWDRIQDFQKENMHTNLIKYKY